MYTFFKLFLSCPTESVQFYGKKEKDMSTYISLYLSVRIYYTYICFGIRQSLLWVGPTSCVSPLAQSSCSRRNVGAANSLTHRDYHEFGSLALALPCSMAALQRNGRHGRPVRPVCHHWNAYGRLPGRLASAGDLAPTPGRHAHVSNGDSRHQHPLSRDEARQMVES